MAAAIAAAESGLDVVLVDELPLNATGKVLKFQLREQGAALGQLSLYRPLDAETILDDVAVPMEVVAAGRRVVFEPEARAFDVASETPRKEFRRKVRTLAGNLQLVGLKPWLLDPRRNRLFVHFVSHKLLRLAVPWCLLAALVCSTVLGLAGSRGFALALAAQLTLYASGAVGWTLERAGVRVRVLTMPYAFLLLNTAALVAPFRYLTRRESAAWKAATP